MNIHSKKGLYYSALIHGLVLLLLVAGTFLSAFQKHPEPHVFHLQAPPSNVSREMPPNYEPALPFTVELPSLESAQPLPKPPPRQKPVAKVSKPAPKPAAKPMSHDQFVKNYDQPKPRKRARPPVSKKNPPVVQKIDVKSIREDLNRNLTGLNFNTQDRAVSAVEQNRLKAFQNNIYELLDQAWRKPKNLSGAQYTATVRFMVTVEGGILFQEFLKPSGNEIFDSSVRAAFSQAGAAESPPWGEPAQMVLTFRLIE